MEVVDVFFLLTVILSISHPASAIRCLSCTGVANPIFCNSLRNCPADNVCGVQKYRTANNDVIYDVDCVSNQQCPMNSSASDVYPCTDCCTTDLCNTQGCDSTDLPTGRGPICFSCIKMADPGTCHTVTQCQKDEQCAVYSEVIRGGHFYSSRCTSGSACQHPIDEIAIVGRRDVRRATLCSRCCHGDFCNDQCPDSNSTVTMTTSSVTTPGTMSHPAEYSSGKKFILLVLPKSTKDSQSNVPQILLAPSVPGVVRVEGPGFIDNTDVQVKLSQDINTLNLTSAVITGQNVIETKALYIKSSVDTAVFLMNYEQYASDMSLVYPTNFCGTNYIVPSYTPVFASVIGIASLESDTTVLIILNTPSGGITYDGHTYTDGDTLSLSLQRLQTFTLSHDQDLTGTRIISSKPVCVMAGTECSTLEKVGCSRFEEMIPPTKEFSTDIVVPALYNRPGVIIRVMSYDKLSDLNITLGTSTHDARALSMYSYTDMDVTADEAVAVVSTSPVLVTMYAKGTSQNADPFMMVVPGIDQYLSTYHFAVPDLGFASHVSIVVPSDQISGLRLDGRSLSPLGNTTVINNGRDFTILYTSVSVGVHVMNHVGGNTFGLFVYGKKFADGYGYFAGMKIRTNL